MSIDPWLPRGYESASGVVFQRCIQNEDAWQIYLTAAKERVLVVKKALLARWVEDRLVDEGWFYSMTFGAQDLAFLPSGKGYRLEAIDTAEAPDDISECQAFVSAIAETRKIGVTVGLQDGIYVERYSRLLPGYTPDAKVDDAYVAGYWITGGVNVSLLAARRMRALVPWLSKVQLEKLAADAGLSKQIVEPDSRTSSVQPDAQTVGENRIDGLPQADFSLPGRPQLEAFFNEHVIDIVRNEERYKALGIPFPGAVLLYGPPGCGKTFAIEKLIDYLDWPSFSMDSGSIGSPFIHETGKKIADTFAQAVKVAPSVVVIDEIDAYLATRDSGVSGQYRVEEVAEFLRAIPKASEERVLVIGMTNRLESLDPVIVRRGRFDHILEVGMPSEEEVLSLLRARLADIPCEKDVDVKMMAKALAGRPLSDVGFIVKEACRIAARSGANQVAAAHVQAALDSAPSRVPEEPQRRRIGFV